LKKLALISVSDKTKIVEFAKGLVKNGYQIIATGNTAKVLSDNKIVVTEISLITGFPEVFDGRVKTLHPKMFGGIFLFLGLFKFVTLSILSFDLLFVVFTFSSIKAMWDMQYFFPRFLFILFIWAIPFSADIYNLDKILGISFLSR